MDRVARRAPYSQETNPEGITLKKFGCLNVATLAVAAGLMLAMSVRAEMPAQIPEAILCTYASGTPSVTGPRWYYIIRRDDSNGDLNYRHPTFNGVQTDLFFNGDGTWASSVNVPTPNNCTNKSIDQLIADGQTRSFGSPMSGAMIYFNLSACPSGWTRQVQLNSATNPDQPMVLCRKD